MYYGKVSSVCLELVGEMNSKFHDLKTCAFDNHDERQLLLFFKVKGEDCSIT